MIATLLLAAQASATGFAPPLDRPLRAVTEATRTDAGITRRFTNAKRIVFRRADAGFRAEVTIESAEPVHEAEDDPTTMFRAGFARIAGRTVVLHLDPAGRVGAIDDQAATWKTFLDGIAALAPTGTSDLDRKRSGQIRAILDALAMMPPERQRAMLGSLIDPLIAADIAATGEAPPRAVRVPAGSAFGTAQIDGLRAVRRSGERLVASVSAAGEVTMRGPNGQVAGHVAIETERDVDPASGLVLETRDAVRIEIPGAPPATRLTVTRFHAR